MNIFKLTYLNFPESLGCQSVVDHTRVNLQFVLAGFKSPFSKDSNSMDHFLFTFINNQPKQMVIFKSLPILSFRIPYRLGISRKCSSYEFCFTVFINIFFLFHFLISASVIILFTYFSLSYHFIYCYHFCFIGIILVDNIRSCDMKIGEDRREMFEALVLFFCKFDLSMFISQV